MPNYFRHLVNKNWFHFKTKKLICPTVEKSSLIVNFMISIFVHLPWPGCLLRCYFFNEYNYR